MALQMIHGNFNGTGAAFYLELGAIPEYIKLYGLEGADPDTFEWSKCMIHDSLTVGGLMRPEDGAAVVDYALATGIQPYWGGETLTTSNQTSTTYGEGVYLSRDDKDYRHYGTNSAGVAGDAASETITDWTLDTSGNFTGHFNGDLTGTYIGAGSRIVIQETASPFRKYEVAITGLTAGQGSADDEVTLSYPVPSGTVQFIGGMYHWSPSPIGHITQPGIKFNLASTPNVNDEMIAFMAIINA